MAARAAYRSCVKSRIVSRQPRFGHWMAGTVRTAASQLTLRKRKKSGGNENDASGRNVRLTHGALRGRDPTRRTGRNGSGRRRHGRYRSADRTDARC